MQYEKQPSAESSRLLTLREFYAVGDLSLQAPFQGGYINFGYWNQLTEELSDSIRTQASRALYQYVSKQLDVGSEDRVLEVGCGTGVGTLELAMQLQCERFVGIDRFEAQIRRSEAKMSRLKTPPREVEFVCAPAESLPFAEGAFTRVFSIEASQHFEKLELFLSESSRVLAPGGRFLNATFFLTDDGKVSEIAKIIPTVQKRVDRIYSIRYFAALMQKCGFRDIQFESIGDSVWSGFDQWLAKRGKRTGWGRNWKKAYEYGWLDYCVFTATKETRANGEEK